MHTHTYHGHDMHHSSSDKVRGYTDESLTSSSSSTLRRSTSPPPPPTPVRVQTRPATVRERVRRVANLAVVGMPAWLVFLFVVMELLTVAWVVRSKMGSESPSPKFARAAAIASLIHLGAVMFPATRRSVMLHVFRVPFQHALIMHRLLGTVSLAWVLAHGIAMAVEYGFEAMLSLESPTGRPHPPLYGFLAGIGFLIVLSFAVPWVRRAKFELFYYVHHTLVIPVVFAVLHVRTLVLYGAPAVMLYLLDRVLRFVRGRTPIVVCRARHVVCGEFNYVRLDLDATTTRSRGDWRAGSYAFAKISSASHLQWHPVSPFPTSVSVGGRRKKKSKEKKIPRHIDSISLTYIIRRPPMINVRGYLCCLRCSRQRVPGRGPWPSLPVQAILILRKGAAQVKLAQGPSRRLISTDPTAATRMQCRHPSLYLWPAAWVSPLCSPISLRCAGTGLSPWQFFSYGASVAQDWSLSSATNSPPRSRTIVSACASASRGDSSGPCPKADIWVVSTTLSPPAARISQR